MASHFLHTSANGIQFIILLNEQAKPDVQGDLCLRLVFCKFLAACTYATLARAEDNVESCVSVLSIDGTCLLKVAAAILSRVAKQLPGLPTCCFGRYR